MISDWQKIDEKLIKDGWRKIIKKTFRDSKGKIFDFEIKDEGTAVCVLALTADKQVILLRQFRPGPEKVLLEMPGGWVEKNETAEQAAKRELMEEAGYEGKLEFAGQSFHCAYSTLVKNTFVAKDCVKTGEQKTDENEFCEVVLVPIDAFREHIKSGELTDMEAGYRGMDYLGLL